MAVLLELRAIDPAEHRVAGSTDDHAARCCQPRIEHRHGDAALHKARGSHRTARSAPDHDDRVVAHGPTDSLQLSLIHVLPPIER
jgi:hypothetical protein